MFLVPKTALWSTEEFKQAVPGNVSALWYSPEIASTMSNAMDATDPGRFAFLMLLSSVIVMLTLRADIWLMGAFLDESQVGIYSAATRFTLPLTIVLNALNTALWPRVSALANAQVAMSLLKKTFRLSFLAAGGGLLYAMVVPLFTPLLFGSRYVDSVLLGQLLCLRYCFSLLICPVGVIGYSFGLARVYWLVNFIQLVIVVIMNVLLLPVYGPIGSALALIVNDVIGFSIAGTVIWRRTSSVK
jgi:O-antigen/teichoic acid export membrane protein